jgi:hypothetical protein
MSESPLFVLGASWQTIEEAPPTITTHGDSLVYWRAARPLVIVSPALDVLVSPKVFTPKVVPTPSNFL